MKARDKPISKAYRSPTEDAAIGRVMKEWRRKQKRRRDREAYLARKTAWETAHPGKLYENRPRFNTRVWKDGGR
jgi:hypothetical protein